MADAVKRDDHFEVPPIAAIAWIPYFFNLSDLPQATRNTYASTRPHAYGMLFDSGNTYDWGFDSKPPDNLQNLQGFQRIIKSQEFRGAFYLEGLKIYFDTPGLLTGYNEGQYAHDELTGYTPFRFTADGIAPDRKFTQMYSKGRGGGASGWGDCKVSISQNGEKATVTQWVDFRLGKLAELGAWVFVHRGAASAWMEVKLTLTCEGRYTIEFYGSSVPDQRLYVGWQNRLEYDMLDQTQREMDDFVLAGHRLPLLPRGRAPQRGGPGLVYP
jgi:hypothetical protein